MLDNEVTSVLKVLRKNGLDVVAIHHHMTGDRPMVISLHYWGRGPAEKLATGFPWSPLYITATSEWQPNLLLYQTTPK